MKIALVQDELVRRGGGEQVCLSFHRAFPEAPIYTSTYNPELTFPEFKKADVRSSWFVKLAKNEKQLRKLFFPFGILAMRQLDLTEFDVVLISGTNSGKYVKVAPEALVITYCFTPFRLAWNPTSYSEYVSSKGLKRLAYDIVVTILRKIDYRLAQRTDWFLAMTEETKERLEVAYKPKKPISIIPPPVKAANFKLGDSTGDYYLLVSRLEFYKKVDLAIQSFNETGFPLVIVGRGSKEAELKRMAGPNITFRSGLTAQELSRLYEGCKAFIFPQHEDYGITPLEANACGKPVIAYGAGGVLTTQIPAKEDGKNATAVFFSEQTVESLSNAVKKTARILDTFDAQFIRANAERFDDGVFVEKIRNYVLKKAKDKI